MSELRTVTTANGSAAATTSGQPTAAPELSPMRPAGRRRRVGLAAVGGLFILLAALLGASLVGSLRSSTTVLVLQADLAAGDVVTEGDLIVAELGADGLGQLSYVEADQQETVVGLTALGPVPAGSLVSPAMFGQRDGLIPSGHSVIGVVLERGALPAGIVQSGDEVELIAAADATRIVVDDVVPTADVVGRATIWMVEPAPELERGTSLSVVVESELVPDVAQAAADNRLRIGLVGQ